MRPGVLLLAGTASLLTLALCLRFPRHRTQSAPMAPAETRDATTVPNEPARSQSRTSKDASSKPAAQGAVVEASETEDTHAVYVTARSDELMELAMKDDSASLDSILGELTNRDPQIRKAALEATIQFGSRDAIPKLLDAAAQTDDSQEKAELTQAAEFLKAPSASEILAQRGPTQRSRSTGKSAAQPPPSSRTGVLP